MKLIKLFLLLCCVSWLTASARVVSVIKFHTYFLGQSSVDDFFQEDVYLGKMYGSLCYPDVSKLAFSNYLKYKKQDDIVVNKSQFDAIIPAGLYENTNCFQARLSNDTKKSCVIYGATLVFDKKGKISGFLKESFYSRACW